MRKRSGIISVTMFFFFIGLMIGVVLVNLSCQTRAADEFLLNRSMLMQIPFMEIKRRKLFMIIAESRLKWLFLFCILTATPLAHRALYLFGIWLGYGAGSLLSLSVVQYKAFGILVFLAAVMPQALFLLPGSCGMMSLILKIRGPGITSYRHGRFRSITSFAVFAALFLIGIFLECYVNPFMLSVFVKIFL